MMTATVSFTSCKKSDDGLQKNNGEPMQSTFTVQVPDTCASVTDLTRYIVEAYEGENNETTLATIPQRVENSKGSLTLMLKK